MSASELPITYLNIGASFMDNFIRTAEIRRRTKALVWPPGYIPYIDPREVGEIAARLLLSPDRRYVHQFLTINNGHDLRTSDEVAAIMSDVLCERVAYDGSREAFLREVTGLWEKRSTLRIGLVMGCAAEWPAVWEWDYHTGGERIFRPETADPLCRRLIANLELSGPSTNLSAACASGHYAVGSSVMFVLLPTTQEVTHDYRS